MAFLYGASIQGIQDYIFATNKLKEMVGGSEIVESLCTTDFGDFLLGLGSRGPSPEKLIGAAGMIKWVIPDRALLDKVFCDFPFHVRKLAPGLTVSQAFVEFSDPLTPDDLEALEHKLKAARNRPGRTQAPDWAACDRAPRTGLPAYRTDGKKGRIDETLDKKLSAADAESMARLSRKLVHGPGDPANPKTQARRFRFPCDFSEITSDRENNWLAVIHADGNGLGTLIQKMADVMRQKGETCKTFTRFSETLDQATVAAAHSAFELLLERLGVTVDGPIPLRPLILGGDDLTLVIRADLAVRFTADFLKAFQKETRERMAFMEDLMGSGAWDGLTACAGIAFVKESYPFHYAYDIAGSLCSEAKRRSKACAPGGWTVPASLAFFKVQSAFSEEWSAIRERELTIPNFEEGKALRLDWGPYAVGPNASGMSSLETLLETVDLLSQPHAPVSGLRRWLTLLYDNPAESPLYLERLQDITRKDFPEDELREALGKMEPGLSIRKPYAKRADGFYSPASDLLTLLAMEVHE
jgi:hypothetical protein